MDEDTIVVVVHDSYDVHQNDKLHGTSDHMCRLFRTHDRMFKPVDNIKEEDVGC